MAASARLGMARRRVRGGEGDDRGEGSRGSAFGLF